MAEMEHQQEQKKEYYLVGFALSEIDGSSPPTLRRLLQNMLHELQINPGHITVRNSM